MHVGRSGGQVPQKIAWPHPSSTVPHSANTASQGDTMQVVVVVLVVVVVVVLLLVVAMVLLLVVAMVLLLVVAMVLLLVVAVVSVPASVVVLVLPAVVVVVVCGVPIVSVAWKRTARVPFAFTRPLRRLHAGPPMRALSRTRRASPHTGHVALTST
jgi:hypothetical protein